MPVINQMAYNRHDADLSQNLFSPYFRVRVTVIAVNKQATVSSLCELVFLFTSFFEVRICLGVYEDSLNYGYSLRE